MIFGALSTKEGSNLELLPSVTEYFDPPGNYSTDHNFTEKVHPRHKRNVIFHLNEN